MDVEVLLRQKRSAILGRWSNMIADTYPADTAKFLGDRKDRFANPVGYTISQVVEALFDELLQQKSAKRASEHLDEMIRIRAVQDFSPAQAVGFIFCLKEAIRHEFGEEIRENGMAAQLLPFESRIDTLALLAFDLYMKCRERIYKLRADEVKRQTRVLVGMADNYEVPVTEGPVKE